MFDGVLFATSLDHCYNPQRAINEAHRVLKSKGFLFIWTGFREPKDTTHLYNFTQKSLMNMLEKFELLLNKHTHRSQFIFMFRNYD